MLSSDPSPLVEGELILDGVLGSVKWLNHFGNRARTRYCVSQCVAVQCDGITQVTSRIPWRSVRVPVRPPRLLYDKPSDKL